MNQPIQKPQIVHSIHEAKQQAVPTYPGEWTLQQIEEALSKPIPDSLLEKLGKDKGYALYCPWYRIPPILSKYAPGWEWSVTKVELSDNRLFMVGALSIPTKDAGVVTREGTGTEILLREKTDKKTGEVLIAELAYGDPMSNSESMAFRRAAAKYRFGLYLYDKILRQKYHGRK